jgi:two-component system sensor histidine kinase DesK
MPQMLPMPQTPRSPQMPGTPETPETPETDHEVPLPPPSGPTRPKDRLRWVWLIYLVFFLMGPILYAPPRFTVYSLLGVAAFLPLYFLAPRLGEGWKMLGPIVGMAAIGLIFVNHNPGASVFFVYAAAECASLGTRRRTLTALVVLMALVIAIALTVQKEPFFIIPAAALVLVIGIVTLHERELRKANTLVRQSREEVERLARIAERERIARDLHDLLGHTLSVVVMKSELAAKLAERDPSRAAQEIREVEAVARQALSEVRSAVTAYRAESLQGELDNARRALDAAGVALEVELEPVRLPPLYEGVLALALREAVTNVVRHARAKTCRIALRRDGQLDERADQPADDTVRLVIDDDGAGARGPEGMGLRGMRERVRTLGGSVEKEVGRRQGDVGTRLTVHLSIPAASAS